MLLPFRADLGWIFYFGTANFRKIAGEFLSEFWWRIFQPCFPRVSGHPKHSRPKFTSRIVGIPLQFHFFEPKIYSRRFSADGGDQKIACGRCIVTEGTSAKTPLLETTLVRHSNPRRSESLGALKRTELRWQREPKTQIFAENRRFSPLLLEIHALGGRRKPQIFAEKSRKPQIWLRHLRSVTFSSA